VGIDNNLRANYFPDHGNTDWNKRLLLKEINNMVSVPCDIRNRDAIRDLFEQHKPQIVIHCAAQPSHDLSGLMPSDDFDINAVGTVNLLDGLRQVDNNGAFIFTSTNKVYGDNPNQLPLTELPTRWDYSEQSAFKGITEKMSLDCCTHSVFGASKVAADIMVQEYGRYFGMNTVCFRLGCVTGRAQAGAELHGFLSYLTRCHMSGAKYRIYGYKGKQVRDNIHAKDVAHAMYQWLCHPKPGSVFNLGGSRENSTSLIEAISQLELLTGNIMPVEYINQNRKGDHICYISDTSEFCTQYPKWSITVTLRGIFDDLISGYNERNKERTRKGTTQ